MTLAPAGKYTIALKKDNVRYKLCKIFFGLDGSYYVTWPYHPANRAHLLKLTVNYALPEQDLPLSEALDVGVLDDDERRLKLSHHLDGFLQFSGPGVTSGKDTSGVIRGMGVQSWPLTSPTIGPSFGVAIAGVERFDVLARDRKTCVSSIATTSLPFLELTDINWKAITSLPSGDDLFENAQTVRGRSQLHTLAGRFWN